MNRDLHVIKEEDECSNHLLNSVIKTIKCAGEANVDKICKKLRNNSNIQFSKFQVEKAIDTAVQKGIFEVKNNVYKLKNGFENTDFRAWKAENEIDQSPNQDQSGKESGSASESDLHVDSEYDYQTCDKLPETQKCPHCGMVKKDSERASKSKSRSKKIKEKSKEASELKRRKKASDNHNKGLKRKKKHNEKQHSPKNITDKNFLENDKDSNHLISLNSSYSDIDFLEAFEEESTKKEKSKLKRKHKRPKKSSSSASENENENENENETWSTFKSDSESEGNENFQKLQRKKKAWNPITKIKKTKLSESDKPKVRKHSTSILVEDWLEHSNEPQGAIMQSNNLLQIEPMDYLVVKNPQPASYFM